MIDIPQLFSILITLLALIAGWRVRGAHEKRKQNELEEWKITYKDWKSGELEVRLNQEAVFMSSMEFDVMEELIVQRRQRDKLLSDLEGLTYSFDGRKRMREIVRQL